MLYDFSLSMRRKDDIQRTTLNKLIRNFCYNKFSRNLWKFMRPKIFFWFIRKSLCSQFLSLNLLKSYSHFYRKYFKTWTFGFYRKKYPFPWVIVMTWAIMNICEERYIWLQSFPLIFSHENSFGKLLYLVLII